MLAALAMVATVAIPWLTGRAVDQIEAGDKGDLRFLAGAIVVVAVVHFSEDWDAGGSAFLAQGMAAALLCAPSFLHIDDMAELFVALTGAAAAATLAAVDHGAPGVYNVVDDDPAPVAEWLPYLAKVVGAKPPLRLPAWLGRALAGEFAVGQMTSSRGSSNEKARKELGWEPRYASWREGFRAWVSG